MPSYHLGKWSYIWVRVVLHGSSTVLICHHLKLLYNCLKRVSAAGLPSTLWTSWSWFFTGLQLLSFLLTVNIVFYIILHVRWSRGGWTRCCRGRGRRGRAGQAPHTLLWDKGERLEGDEWNTVYNKGSHAGRDKHPTLTLPLSKGESLEDEWLGHCQRWELTGEVQQMHTVFALVCPWYGYSTMKILESTILLIHYWEAMKQRQLQSGLVINCNGLMF